MFRLIGLCLGTLVRLLRARRSLLLENLALRQQLALLKRRHPRPRLELLDKFFWVAVRRFWSGWQHSLIAVTPEIRSTTAPTGEFVPQRPPSLTPPSFRFYQRSLNCGSRDWRRCWQADGPVLHKVTEPLRKGFPILQPPSRTTSILAHSANMVSYELFAMPQREITTQTAAGSVFDLLEAHYLDRLWQICDLPGVSKLR
jgi:hypothetical protein